MRRVHSFGFCAALSLVAVTTTQAQIYAAWTKSGVVTLGTTAAWSNYTGAALTDFPVLVRLDSNVFNFSEAKAGGADIRFSTADRATALPYEIEIWDAAGGQASIWVKIPAVAGNATQQIRMYWGNASAASESSGANVFATANGYVGVWHLSEPASDTLNRDATSNGHHGVKIDDNTKRSSASVIGKSESPLGSGQVYNRNKVYGYTEIPAGRVDLKNKSLTISAWIKRDSLKGGDFFVAQGTQDPGIGIRLGFNHYNYFHFGFGGGVDDPQYPFTTGFTDTAGWHFWTGTYNMSNNEMAVYRDGEFQLKTTTRGAFQGSGALHFGWAFGPSGEYYHPGGIVDEIRVTQVPRSADWIKLSYLNQKTNQKLAGFPVPDGCAENFSAAPASVSVAEGTPVTLTGTAKCAQLYEWVKVANGVEVPVDFRGTRLSLSTRVRGNTVETYRFKALYAGTWRTRDIPVTVTESIPEPIFALEMPPYFDISDPSGVPMMLAVAAVSNKAQIAASASPVIHYRWNVTRFGELNFTSPRTDDTLEIYSMGVEGDFEVTVCVDNGGPAECQTRGIRASRTGIWGRPRAGSGPALRFGAGSLTWIQDAEIRVWSLQGRLLFHEKGRKGRQMSLSSDAEKLLRAPGLVRRVDPISGGKIR